MSGPHRIGLQAAWARDGSAWTRAFGRPTGIGPGDRVWLVLERPVACVAALNGRPLPVVAAGPEAWRHDVTVALRARNELRLDFGAAAGTAAAADRAALPLELGAVAIEIEPADAARALDTRAR